MNTKPWLTSLTCIMGVAASFSCYAVNAHDGGFGHSRRTIFFDSTKDEFILEYRLTRSSDEALLEMTIIDDDGDGQISSKEQESYFGALGIELADQFDVQTAAGDRERPRLLEYRLQPNLVQSFRYSIETTASKIRFVDRNFPHKPGVVKIISGSGAKAELAEPTDLNHAEQVSLKVGRVAK